MVSNQDGLGTDSFPQQDFEIPQNFILDVLSSQGVHFSDILICPHFPHENCTCRKPKIGLVEKYLQRTDWDRTRSYVIGDRETDVQLGTNMGIGSFKYNRETLDWNTIARNIADHERTAHVVRNTRETKIDLYVNLDHPGDSKIDTGIGFFDHMLDQIASHGNFQLILKVDGDLPELPWAPPSKRRLGINAASYALPSYWPWMRFMQNLKASAPLCSMRSSGLPSTFPAEHSPASSVMLNSCAIMWVTSLPKWFRTSSDLWPMPWD